MAEKNKQRSWVTPPLPQCQRMLKMLNQRRPVVGMGREASERLLTQSALALGLNLNPLQQQQLLRYAELIQKWSRVYNLTAVHDIVGILQLHILDSLTVAACLQGWRCLPQKILDVGSGAGLPGVVLAIVFPEINILCVEAVAKKSSFIQHAAATLRLGNLQGLHHRVETLPAQTEECIISRAFASLEDFVRLSQNSLLLNGCWLAMKGKIAAEEVDALNRTEAKVFHVKPLQIPEVQAQRHLLYLCRRDAVTHVRQRFGI